MGVRAKKRASPAHSELKRCTLISSLRVPLQAGGTEPTRPTRFPSRSGGNLQEGGNYELWLGDWYKGTTVRREVFEAGAIFPSASVSRQARCIALTPFVPLSPPCGRGGERAAGRTAVRPYTPLPQRGRGDGGEGEKACESRTQ